MGPYAMQITMTIPICVQERKEYSILLYEYVCSIHYYILHDDWAYKTFSDFFFTDSGKSYPYFLKKLVETSIGKHFKNKNVVTVNKSGSNVDSLPNIC
jgi:hypothetical protein